MQVKSVEAYLKLFHPHVVELLALCESLTASLDDSQREEGTSIPFSSTLSDQAIQDGISKVNYSVSTLVMDMYNVHVQRGIWGRA